MEELKINGVDAFVAFLRAYAEEAKVSALFGTNDKMSLLFINFQYNLFEKGYSEDDINNFINNIVVPILQNKIK